MSGTWEPETWQIVALLIAGALLWLFLSLDERARAAERVTPFEQDKRDYARRRAEVDREDDAWVDRLTMEGERLKALFRQGHTDAVLPIDDWDPPRKFEDGLRESGFCDTIYELRKSRRSQAFLKVLAEVDKLRWEMRELIEAPKRREREEREARGRAERLRLQAEREAQARAEESRQAAQREAAQRQRQDRINRKVLRPYSLQADAGVRGITFGTKVADGGDLIVPLVRLQHTLVVGATGAGKSVFVHGLVFQLVERTPDVEQVVIFDLKGGVEFSRYRKSPRVRLVWEFSDVAAELDRLNAVMLEREAHMRANDLQNWPGARIFVVIDEYAEIQSEIDGAVTKEEKAAARQVATSLVRIGRRARALGIVLICALQKATTDAMDSALRANLNGRVCLRVNSRQFAASVLDDLDELPVDPLDLKPGHFIYYDAARGTLDHAVAQIAPGVTL